MKKSLLIFIIVFLVIGTVVLWILNSGLNSLNLLMLGCISIVVLFALFNGIKRFRSASRGEPAEDELSKKMLTKASSISYYISIYFWLVLMNFSDRIKLESHSLIGAGVLGTAIIFALCWLVIWLTGLRNE
jgi:peptidoglycan/LPS O-acetylase OafA/YrhL